MPMVDKKQRTALQRTYIDFQAWAKDNNIYSKLYPLNHELWGFVYKSKNNEYLIVINNHLTTEMQKEVFCHEVEHILYDMPQQCYLIGLDMQHTTLEKKADKFAKSMVANFFR